MNPDHVRGHEFDRAWSGPAALKPRCYRSQHEKDTWLAVCVEDEYGTPQFTASDAVIDIGSHMGAWSYRAWLNGSRRIHAFECDPEMREAFALNLADCDGVTQYREATAESFDAVVRMLGVVRFLKIDCEGCEYPVLYGSKQLGRVLQIAGEWHHNRPHIEEENIERLAQHLSGLGFMVYYNGTNHGLGHFWAHR